MQLQSVQEVQSAQAWLNGKGSGRSEIRVVRSVAAFIRRALQPHGSCCAAQYGTIRYNTVRLSRRGRGQEFD
jgi:hypothetical protein